MFMSFFLKNLLLIYFIFILSYGNGFRKKKQILAIFFFFWFKMGHKGLETTHTHSTSNAFGLVTSNKYTKQWCSKSFQKGEQNLKHEEHSGRPPEVDNDQLKAIVFLKQLEEKVPKNSMRTIQWSFSI